MLGLVGVRCFPRGMSLMNRFDGVPCRRLSVRVASRQQASYTKTSSSINSTISVDLYPFIEDQLEALGGKGENVKVLHFVRHAQGTHNVEKKYRDADQFDAKLTPYGIEQCRALAEQTKHLQNVDLLLTSPMTRCIETAIHGFASHLEAGKPLLALETIRETVNFTCDRRRTIDELSGEFDFVDFSDCSENDDPIWASYEVIFGSQDDHRKHRESDDPAGIAERARSFLEWVSLRQEREMLVSTHSAFMSHIFNHAHEGYAEDHGFEHLSDELSPIFHYKTRELEQYMRKPWENCELRSIVVKFK